MELEDFKELLYNPEIKFKNKKSYNNFLSNIDMVYDYFELRIKDLEEEIKELTDRLISEGL